MLEWDSRFFGRRIARVENERLRRADIDEILHWVSERQVDCLYFLCRPNDDESVAVAEENGFHLTDIRIELSWRVRKIENSLPIILRQFQESDLAALQQIATDIYTDTRFYYDRQFARSQAAALYREWVTKSCQTETVFVIPSEEEISGFITCNFDQPELGRIGLIGVKGDAQGKGHGRLLVSAAQQYFQGNGATEVRVVTQGRNIAAQRLYQAQGFRTHSVGLWYHKWFE